MNIVVTGSLGNISKPLTLQLIREGHVVTVISSDAGKQQEIVALNAKAAIGSLEDVDFLTRTFTGNDAVYSMIPPTNYFDPNLDLAAYYKLLGDNYARAISRSGVRRLVHLSSIGAHLPEGNGILANTYIVEHILGQLQDVAVTFMRPVSFYYNLLSYMHGIRTEGAISANYGMESLIPWVSPKDIAAAVAEALTQPSGAKVRYVASEELNGRDTAQIIGAAIGMPDLEWKLISDKQALDNLLAIGMNSSVAEGLVEMYGALQTGLLSEDYHRNKPIQMGQVKMADYAREFAAIYQQ